MIGQQWYVVPTFPEGGHPKGKDIQTIEQVFPKPTAGDLLLQIPVGSGHKSEIRGYGFLAADAFEFFTLEHAEEPHLDIQRDISDLVQENSAGMGQLETTDPFLNRPGKGPFFVAEKLAGNKVL